MDPSKSIEIDEEFIRFDDHHQSMFDNSAVEPEKDDNKQPKRVVIKTTTMKGQEKKPQPTTKRQTQLLPGALQMGKTQPQLKQKTSFDDIPMKYDRAVTPSKLEIRQQQPVQPDIPNSEREVDNKNDQGEQIMFLDDIVDLKPKAKNRLFSEEDDTSMQGPEILPLSDRVSQKGSHREPSNREPDEDQVLIFDNVEKKPPPGAAKIQVAGIGALSAKLTGIKLKNRMKGVQPTEVKATDATKLQKELIDKFEGRVDDTMDIDKMPEHLFKKTESFDKSKSAGGDTQLKSIEGMPLTPQESAPKGPYFNIGVDTTALPEQLKLSNQVSPYAALDAKYIALKLAIIHVCKTPILPFVLILMIIDAAFTDLRTWRFLLFYFLILCTIPPYLWYLYFSKGLANEINFDNRQVLRFDFKQGRFGAVPRYQLKTGDIILLQKEERFPTNVILLSIIDEDERPTQIELSDGSTKQVFLSTLKESDIAQLGGRVEYDSHILPLLTDESSLSFKFKLGDFKKFGEMRVFDHDLCPPELTQSNGQAVAMVIITSVNNSYTSLGLKQKILYEHLDTLDPRRTVYILLATSVILSIILSIAGSVWAKDNQDRHRYISSAEIGYNNSFINIFINHLLVYQGIVPVFLEIIRPLFPLVAMYKFNRDTIQDGDRSGKTSIVASPQTLENLGRLKFVNYNSDVFSRPWLRVQKCFLLSKEPQDGELWPCANDQPHEQEDINKEQIIECFEKSLLSVPFGNLSPQFAALQHYIKLMKLTQYGYNQDQKTILLPSEILRYYQLIFQCKQDDGSFFYLYQMPPEEEEEEKEDEEEDEEEDLQKLNEKVEKEKTMQAYRSQKHYIWMHISNRESDWVTRNPKLESFVELSDENSLFIQSLQIDSADFKLLQKKLGKTPFKTKVLPVLTEELVTLFREKLQPLTCFMFHTVPRHDFHLLLDLNLAEVRQWVFTQHVEFDEEDPTLRYLQQYMQFVQWDPEEDILEQLNLLKGSLTTRTEQSLIGFKIQNNLYIQGTKYVVLALTPKIVDQALSQCKPEFLELLLMPSFIIGLALREDQINELMRHQKAKADDQAILTFGSQKQDILLCQNQTVRVCLADSESNLYTDNCQVRLTNTNALSKLILTHSRQTHIRISHFILFQIYKSLLITMTEFFFSFFNGYSQSMLFTASFHFMYQTFFTSFFSLFLFLLYSDVSHFDIRKNAFAFAKCQKDHFFNKGKIFLIFVDTIYQGFIIFYVPASILQYANDQTGIIEGFYYISLVSFLTLLLTVTFQPFIYLSTVTKEQVWLFMTNALLCILILMTTCSSENAHTNIPQYVEHLGELLNSTKSVFIICFLTAINLTPTLIVHQYVTVCDPPLVNMIHSYVDEEVPEKKDKNKDKAKDKQKEKTIDEPKEQIIDEEKPKEQHDQSLDNSRTQLKRE